MNIIPHNPLNVQVSIPEFTDEIGAIWDTNQILTLGLTDTQRTAYTLYDMGLSVMPQPHNRKGGLPWKRLQYGRLHRDDRSYGLRNLFAGDCNLAVMCGASSGNLFVIDCESEDSFIYHLNAMRRRSIPLWTVRTARGGHIYLRATNGEVANVEPGIMRDAEIKGRGGYVLAPPSVHPDGTPYRWLMQEGDCIPSVHTDNIDWLCDARGEHIRLVAEAPPNSERGNWKMHVVSPASNLSNATRDYMRNGGSTPEGSRNKRLFSAACDLCGNNYTQTEAQHILLPIAAMSGLPIAEIQHTISSAFSQARTPARPNKATIHYEWRYALLWMTQHQWDSRTASSDRALMIALIERARVSSNEENVFRASIRELSELARISTGTVRRGLERLQEVGTLKLYGHDKTSGASLWRFGIKIINVAKSIELNMDTVCIPPHWLKYSESIFNSDVVEQGGLGHASSFLYQFLRTLEQPMMPCEIAESLGISVNQVNYGLRVLSEHELARRLDRGWYPVKMTLPELEILFESVAGKGDARARRYREERQIFAGVIMMNARIKQEGRCYTDAVQAQLRYQQEAHSLLDDPLIALGLELGGVIRLPQ